MRHGVPSRICRNLRLLQHRECICFIRSREPLVSKVQSRQIFGIRKLNLRNWRHDAENVVTSKTVIFKKRRNNLILDYLLPLGLGILGSWTYNKFVFTPLEQAIDDPDLQNLSEEEVQPIFVPLPFTCKEIKQPSYLVSDPEWQEFVKLGKQQDLIQQICLDLTNIILSAVKKHTLLSLRVGKKMKVRRYWLDIDFPLEPPAEYVQSGIEIGTDYIAWTTQPVDSMTVRRLQRALWPSSMIISSWSFVKVVTADFFEKIANLIGFKTETPPTIEHILARHRQLIKGSRVPPHDASSLEPQLYPAGVEVAPVSSIRQPKHSHKDSEDELEHSIEEIITELRQEFSGPLSAFKHTFAKIWREPTSNPPRGCIIVSGLVEIDTPKAYLIFDVMAHWDPQTKSYNMENLAVGLKKIKLKKHGLEDGL